LAHIQEKQEVSEGNRCAVFLEIWAPTLAWSFGNQDFCRSGKIEPTLETDFRRIEQKLDISSIETSLRSVLIILEGGSRIRIEWAEWHRSRMCFRIFHQILKVDESFGI